MNKTTIESLCNEFFIDLFEYFNAVDLFRAFYGLNIRFNSLLFSHLQSYRIDFRSISKEDFHTFYQIHFPSIFNQIIYLRISDDEDTPFQCAHFLSTGLKFSQFINLRSLTFNCVSTDPKITELFFSDLCHLHYLTHLKFVDCRLFHAYYSDFQGVIDQIWNLPKLTHLYLEVNAKGNSNFCIPNFVSTSLQYVTILKTDWISNNFPKLLEKTPYLQKFSTSLGSYEEDDRPPFEEFIPSFKNQSVKKLFIFNVRSQRVMTNLFQLLPNVNHLKVQTFSLKLDGHQWEQIIVKYLPQLKVLQLMMDFCLHPSTDNHINEEKVDEILATYRTSFWIEHHQWFIRCHWRLWRGYLSISFYSLPYAFDYFPSFVDELNSKTKSTCSSEMHFTYDSLRNFAYEPSFFNDDVLSCVQLSNIEILTLKLPIDHRFMSIVITFQNLHSLDVTIPTRNYRSRLQSLLNNAPRLYSLAFNSWATSTMPPYEYTSKSIRRLDLRGYDQSRRPICYDSKQCMKLSQTPLGIQCRVLMIEVEHPESIVVLIKSMINLRTLDVLYKYDDRRNKYDVLELLRPCLPSTWNITRFCYGNFIIQS